MIRLDFQQPDIGQNIEEISLLHCRFLNTSACPVKLDIYRQPAGQIPSLCHQPVEAPVSKIHCCISKLRSMVCSAAAMPTMHAVR